MTKLNLKTITWKQNHIRQRLLFFMLIVCSTAGIVYFNYNYAQSSALRKCFVDRFSETQYQSQKLEDVLLSAKKPTPGRSIFFHETSCSKTGELTLNARQACAIESAAAANKNFDVFVLFASPTYLVNSTNQPVLDALLSYPNVHLRNVNLWTYAAGTPINDWLKDGQLFSSKYVLSHTSDFLRYLTLWRWGGTYLDLDVVVQKSFENIKPNYAGAESERFIAAGVLNFEADGFGHQIADLCLRNFQLGFDGSDWGNNGPGVITRVAHEICKTKTNELMTRDRCFGFKVFPIGAFYAVRWWNWLDFFSEPRLSTVMNATKDSIVVHVWNKHSKNKKVKVGSNVAYGRIAEKHCPKVYASCGEYF